jgi:hypothetical protein
MSDTAVKLAANMPTDRTVYHDASAYGLGSGKIIPRALGDGEDGRSAAIDHNKPVKVTVDPGQTSGFSLDMTKLPLEVKDKIIRKVMNDKTLTTTEQRFQAIGAEIARLEKETAESEDKPSTMAQAKKASFAQPVLNVAPAVMGFANPPQVAKLMPANTFGSPQNILTAGGFAPSFTSIAPGEPSVAELNYLRQLEETNSILNQYVAAYKALQQEATALQEQVAQLQQLRQEYQNLYDAYIAIKDQDLASKASVALELIPGIESSPKPAREKVVFSSPNLGMFATSYHAVLQQNDVLVLIYDSRFEYGTQYLPPVIEGQEIEVAIVSTQQKLRVQSLGLNIQLGFLDIAILFITGA